MCWGVRWLVGVSYGSSGCDLAEMAFKNLGDVHPFVSSLLGISQHSCHLASFNFGGVPFEVYSLRDPDDPDEMIASRS